MYGISYIWLMFMGNVGEYTSPMDPIGLYDPMFLIIDVFVGVCDCSNF